MEIVVHEIATDGLPDMEALTGRVAFIFDGCIVSGWPLERDDPDVAGVYTRLGYDGDDTLWEGNSDVAHTRPMSGVTHWLEFPVPGWEIERPAEAARLRAQVSAACRRAGDAEVTE